MSKQRVFVCLSSTRKSKRQFTHETTIEMNECDYEGQLAYHEDGKIYLSDTYPAVEIPLVI